MDSIGESKTEFHLPGRILNKPVFPTESSKAKLIYHPIPNLEELKNKHQDLIAIKQDISAHDELEKFIDKCHTELGEKIDILINNAGITKDNLSIRMDKNEWDFDLVNQFNDLVEGLSVDIIHSTANQYFSTENIVQVTLYPEK